MINYHNVYSERYFKINKQASSVYHIPSRATEPIQLRCRELKCDLISSVI